MLPSRLVFPYAGGHQRPCEVSEWLTTPRTAFPR
jgi:hypothetical protein